jgi:hypothetical protein
MPKCECWIPQHFWRTYQGLRVVYIPNSPSLLPFAADGLVDTYYAQSTIQGDEVFPFWK